MFTAKALVKLSSWGIIFGHNLIIKNISLTEYLILLQIQRLLNGILRCIIVPDCTDLRCVKEGPFIYTLEPSAQGSESHMDSELISEGNPLSKVIFLKISCKFLELIKLKQFTIEV